MVRKEESVDRSLEDSSGFKTSSVWHRQLESTSTVDDVLSTVRDYLASLTPRDLSHLPETHRPMRIKGDDDIEYWTFKLSQHTSADHEAWVDVELMQEIFNHFLHASVRLTQIHKAMASAEDAQPH